MKLSRILKLILEGDDDDNYGYLGVNDAEGGKTKSVEPSHDEKMKGTKTYSPEEFESLPDEDQKWEPEKTLGKTFKNKVEVESILLKSYEAKRYDLEIYISFKIIPTHAYKRLHTSTEFEGKNSLDAILKDNKEALLSILIPKKDKEGKDIPVDYKVANTEFIKKLNELFSDLNIKFTESDEQSNILGIDLNNVKRDKTSIKIPCYNVARLAEKQWEVFRRQLRKAVGEDFLEKNKSGNEVYGDFNLRSFLNGMDKKFGLKTIIYPEMVKLKDKIDKEYLSRYKTYYSYFDWDTVPIQWESESYRDKYKSESVAEKQFPFLIILKFKLPASLKTKEDIEKRLEVKVEDFKKAISNSEIFASDEYFTIKP